MTAPCRDNPELWFSADAKDQQDAASICYTCPMKQACARAALDLRPTHGMWAGIDVGRDAHPWRLLQTVAGGGAVEAGHAHGTKRQYAAGCRCVDCIAGLEQRKERAAKRRAGRPVPHGMTGYKTYKCRCDVCKTAHRVYRASEKARVKAVAS